MKITIETPHIQNGVWILRKGKGGTPLRKKTASYTLLALERFLTRNLASKNADKLSVRVVYPDGENETIKSVDKNYLLYATSCFLEDYLSDEIMKRFEKSYLESR